MGVAAWEYSGTLQLGYRGRLVQCSMVVRALHLRNDSVSIVRLITKEGHTHNGLSMIDGLHMTSCQGLFERMLQHTVPEPFAYVRPRC